LQIILLRLLPLAPQRASPRHYQGPVATAELRRATPPGGADDGDRTRDPQLGKLMLYQLSYVRSIGPKIAQSVLKFGGGTADERPTREIGHPRR
jgi:hypothetical protein